MKTSITIRRAQPADIPALHRLLEQVLAVHHQGRPDLFKAQGRKYTDEELRQLLADDGRPIFVGEDEAGEVRCYAFCIFQQQLHSNNMTDVKTLYIDDLCVDERARGGQLGRRMYEYVLRYAKESGCYNVTLNVWACNEGARRFYEKMGLVPQKIGLEKIL